MTIPKEEGRESASTIINVPLGTPVTVVQSSTLNDHVRRGFGFSIGVAWFVCLACGIWRVLHWMSLA